MIEAAAGIAGIYVLGLLVELAVPDSHSHGTPILLMYVLALGVPAVVSLVLARAVLRMLELQALQATRWRFLHHALVAIGAAFAMLLAVTLVWALVR